MLAEKLFVQGFELPGGYCKRTCAVFTPGVEVTTTASPGTPGSTGTTPTVTPGSTGRPFTSASEAYNGYRAAFVEVSEKRIACVCENGECGYKVKHRGQVIPLNEFDADSGAICGTVIVN